MYFRRKVVQTCSKYLLKYYFNLENCVNLRFIKLNRYINIKFNRYSYYAIRNCNNCPLIITVQSIKRIGP